MKEPKTKMGEFWRDKIAPALPNIVDVGLDLVSGDFNDAFKKVKSAIADNVQDEEQAKQLTSELEAKRTELEHDWRIRQMEEETKRLQLANEAQKTLLDNELESYRAQIADVGNARSADIERLKLTGKKDWLMSLVGVAIIVSFLFYVYVSVFYTVNETNRDFFIEMRSASRDAMFLLIGYYYGTSRSSRHKDELIAKSSSK